MRACAVLRTLGLADRTGHICKREIPSMSHVAIPAATGTEVVPAIMGIGPVPVTGPMLQTAGWPLDELDLMTGTIATDGAGGHAGDMAASTPNRCRQLRFPAVPR
jgi:acetyl-CoA acetyltransferase